MTNFSDSDPDREMSGRKFAGACLGVFLGCVLQLSASAFHPAVAAAGQVEIFLPQGSGIFTKKVTSFKERRMQSIIPQSLDFSCGAAAMATLLKYHFGHEITELDALKGMFQHGDQESIRKRGFSMLDMKRFALSRGLQAEGFKVEDPAALKKLDIPVISLIDTAKYRHFVVIRGADDRFVYLADPSWGNRRLPWEDFRTRWTQAILVVTGPIAGKPAGLKGKESEELESSREFIVRNWETTVPRFAMDPSFAILTVTRISQGGLADFVGGIPRIP